MPSSLKHVKLKKQHSQGFSAHSQRSQLIKTHAQITALHRLHLKASENKQSKLVLEGPAFQAADNVVVRDGGLLSTNPYFCQQQFLLHLIRCMEAETTEEEAEVFQVNSLALSTPQGPRPLWALYESAAVL